MDLNNLEQREAPSRKLYTGFAPIQIIAVNPNVNKLKTILNSEDVKEPEYVGEENTRIDFWYKNHPSFETELRGKFSIWISNKTRESQTGKIQYMDDYSRTVWAESLGMVESVTSGWSVKPDKKTLREAKEGEERIYNLLKVYGNINPQNQMFKLDNWNSLVQGNGSELEDFFAFFNQNMAGVKVLMGIKDAKYQDVYTNKFLGLYGRVTDRVEKEITGDYGYKHFYNNSFDFKEFDSESIPTEGEIETSGSEAADMFAENTGGSTPAPATANDNPFMDF